MRKLRSVGFTVLAYTMGLFPASDGLAQDVSAKRLEVPSRNVPPEWLTKAERTEFRETPRYAETVEYCRRLASASPWIDYQTFGISPEGRPMPLVVASKDKAFTPEAARATGKLVVLIQNCIHAGECAGKDASLMLLRDIAVTRTREALLDQTVLVVMPIFSVDGHERFSPYSRINQNGPEQMGWRVTSRNLDLNRDYVKADAVEMRAWLSVWNAWRPDLHFDNHTTDGGDWQYDITFDADTHATAAPQIAEWLRASLYPAVFTGLEADGHVPMIYFGLVDSMDLSKGISSGGFSPRFSTGYVSLRNRPSILVETHALKTFRTRVIAHYDIMLHTLELLNGDPGSLRKAARAADAASVEMGTKYDPDATLAVAVGRSEDSVPLTFRGFASRHELSEISGGLRTIYDKTQPIQVDTVWHKGTKVTKTVNPPLAYIIPPQWTEVIELVTAHGLRSERLVEATTIEVESYRFSDVSFGARPYEGRFTARFKVDPVAERRTFLPGSVVVPLDQPDAKVAIHMFEPEAPDSLVHWGFFNAVFERKEYAGRYALEEMARRMLASDPELRKEFERKIAGDREFAGNSWARLFFFYERSPYWDVALNVYPVARLTAPLVAKTEP